MLKKVHYLSENPNLVPLLLEDKICLVGIEHSVEQEALLEVIRKWNLYVNPFWK